MLDYRRLWDEALPFPRFVALAEKQKDLWEGNYRLARVPEWARRPDGLGAPRRLLALAEDWCADTASTIPVLARWAHETPGLELRILRRDSYPAVMDRYLTNGTRSIPIVLVLDENFEVTGQWGPYPGDLGPWVSEHLPPVLPKEEFVKGKRTWYARDRGETTIREVGRLVGVAAIEPATAAGRATEVG